MRGVWRRRLQKIPQRLSFYSGVALAAVCYFLLAVPASLLVQIGSSSAAVSSTKFHRS